jgi:hypothetical protein
VQIEPNSVTAQTEIATHGLTSDVARAFLEHLPRVEDLMGRLNFQEIAGEAEPPIVEHLVSPNTLRQRRYRDRHRNAAVRHSVTKMAQQANEPAATSQGCRRERHTARSNGVSIIRFGIENVRSQSQSVVRLRCPWKVRWLTPGEALSARQAACAAPTARPAARATKR